MKAILSCCEARVMETCTWCFYACQPAHARVSGSLVKISPTRNGGPAEDGYAWTGIDSSKRRRGTP